MMPEQIWILLLFLAVILFNLMTGLLNRRRARDAADQEKKGPQAAPTSRRAPPRVVVTPPRIDVSPPPPPAVHPKPRRMTLRRGDLRRAIVLMTLLGPPRAFDDEAHDVKR
jgi:hypothetical protein